MYTRTLADKLVSLARQFPVIALTGPRQSGKTTLARLVFADHAYVTLEDPDERDFALSDPRGFLRRFSGGVILDEIQRAPALFSYLQGIVDSEDVPGRFIITGSQQFSLLEKVTQTLAGRVAVTHLLPLSLDELWRWPAANPWHVADLPQVNSPPASLEDILFSGLYPRIHDKGLNPRDWLASYYQVYVERDVRDLLKVGNLEAFQRFVRLCAGRSGQLLNLSSLAVDCGISHPTARSWLSILQAGFIIHLLPPHHANFTKRLVKNPKLYFLDSGLLCYLLRIREPVEIPDHAMKGAIFETFVVAEAVKAFMHRGETPPLYFWRDKTGHEVDLLIDNGTELLPVEIKSSETIDRSFFNGLKYFSALGSPAATRGALIHGGSACYLREQWAVRPWHCPV